MRRLKDKSSPSQPSATLDEIQANASYIVFDAGAEEEEAGGAPAGTTATRGQIPGGTRSAAAVEGCPAEHHTPILVHNKHHGPTHMRPPPHPTNGGGSAGGPACGEEEGGRVWGAGVGRR